MASELTETDIGRVADWFAKQHALAELTIEPPSELSVRGARDQGATGPGLRILP
jgi:hypothetical protein